MNCIYCGSSHTRRSGYRKLSNGQRRQRYKCRDCKRRFSLPDPANNPKVLYFDIETSPMAVWSWKVGKTYIPATNVKEDWFVISWAAKWLCDSRILSAVCTPKEAKAQNDRRVIELLWKLLDEADIVVGHNSNRFDIRKVNWRFLKWDIPQPSYYRTVDTLKEARRYFAASSNKLDYLAQELGFGGKEGNRPGLWLDAVQGDKGALKEMRHYNEHDILIGEGIYLKLRSWMRTHPNMGLYYETDELRCKNCGSDEITLGGTYKTPTQTYVAWRCTCGAIGRTDIRLTKRKRLLK